MCAVPGWRYDKSYQVVEYTFSNLDLTTLANISNGDTRSVSQSDCSHPALVIEAAERMPQ